MALNDRLSLLRRVSFRSAVKRLLARTIELPCRRKREKFFYLALNDRLRVSFRSAVKRLLARIELPHRRKREKFFLALNKRLSFRIGVTLVPNFAVRGRFKKKEIFAGLRTPSRCWPDFNPFYFRFA